MDFHIVLHAFVAIAIGISVSMDVSGFNLAKAGDAEYSRKPIKRSLMHAFWHGLFISLGIGLITFVSDFFEWLIITFDLAWMFEWIIEFLPWFDPVKFPIWFLTILGVLLWLKLYWDKIRGEDDHEHLPNWCSRFFSTQLAYIAVAMDMWFLTPLLKSIIQDFSGLEKIGFVAVVTSTVFACSMISISYGQKLIRTKHVQSLFYWLVTFVLVEPVITGYFTVRAAWWAFTGEMKSSTDFIIVTVIIVILLCRGKFKHIIESKWKEAEEAIKQLSVP